MKAVKSVDEYIQNAPEEVQPQLKELRKLIKKEAPEAVESMSYAMPGYKINGKPLVYFAGWKTHIALYPTSSQMEEISEIKKYRTGKGTLQFPLDKPLPLPLIRKIMQYRIKENLEKK